MRRRRRFSAILWKSATVSLVCNTIWAWMAEHSSCGHGTVSGRTTLALSADRAPFETPLNALHPSVTAATPSDQPLHHQIWLLSTESTGCPNLVCSSTTNALQHTVRDVARATRSITQNRNALCLRQNKNVERLSSKRET